MLKVISISDTQVAKTKVGNETLKTSQCQALVAHAFNPSTQKTEAVRSLSSRPTWSTEQVPGQSGLHREILS